MILLIHRHTKTIVGAYSADNIMANSEWVSRLANTL